MTTDNQPAACPSIDVCNGYMPSPGLSAQAQTSHQGAIALDVQLAQIVEMPPPLADHHQKTSPIVMIALVGLQMLGEVVDSLGQQRHLGLGRARISGVVAVFGDDGRGVFHGNARRNPATPV